MDTPKIVFLEKYFSKTFVTIVLCIFCYHLQGREKIPQFRFFSKRIFPIIYLAKKTTQVVFSQEKNSTTFIKKVFVFLL